VRDNLFDIIGSNRKPRAEDFETPEGAYFLTALYRDKCATDAEAAAYLGVTRKTILNWRRKSKIIDQAIARGKRYIDTRVEDSLLQQALQGDVRAITYWLQNRKPEQWKSETTLEKERQQLANERARLENELLKARLKPDEGIEDKLKDYLENLEQVYKSNEDDSE